MTLTELDAMLAALLHTADFPMDPSLNGVQVENSAPEKKEIRTIAYAVDACAETIRRAAACAADVLLVHHGLLWGQCRRVTGSYYRRLAALFAADMALCAYHLPIDAHPALGNNAVLADRLGLAEREPFGVWRGAVIGCIGTLRESLTVYEAAARLFPDESPVVLPFGPEKALRAAIISGGAGEDVEQAIAAGADLYITGEIGHENYHTAREHGISVIGGGHYRSETGGVAAVAAHIGAETGIRTVFIDVPTGL